MNKSTIFNVVFVLVGCSGAPPPPPPSQAVCAETTTASAAPLPPPTTLAGATSNAVVESPPTECGVRYASPMGLPATEAPRACAKSSARTYKPRYSTIGHRILDLESEACGVPDSAYQLLDDLIARADAKNWGPMPSDATARRDFALKVSADIGQLLVDGGFELYIPVRTLADALTPNRTSPKTTYLEDCDTASFIYLSIAEQMKLPMSLVEIQLSSGSGHNYVRWQLDQNSMLDWDTNGRYECVTPTNQPAWEGRSLTPDDLMAYVLTIRSSLWKKSGELEKALVDLRRTMALDPGHPDAFNNLTWLIVTNAQLQSKKLRSEALGAAKRAIELNRTSNVLDTLACAYAANGDYAAAQTTAKQATELAVGDQKERFLARLTKFLNKKNCVGEE